MNRSKRELERLNRIAKTEGVYDDARFRDEIAKRSNCRTGDDGAAGFSAEKSGKNSLECGGPAQDQGQRNPAALQRLMMLAAGPFCPPFIEEPGSRLARHFPGGMAAKHPSHPLLQHATKPPSMVDRMNATQYRRPDVLG